MPYEFKITRRVEFSDTDMEGIMHYSNYFRFMETAEHAFFRSLGYSVVLSRSGLTFAFRAFMPSAIISRRCISRMRS